MNRKVSIFIAAAAALTATACSPVSNDSTDSTMSSSLDAVANQATVYASHTAFVKGPKSKDSNNGDSNNGNSGSSGSQCTMPDSLVLDVGNKGGSFSYNGSSFVIPKNAVSQNVHIVMIPQVDSTVAIQFYPEGLQFNANALPTLTINTDCIGDPANASIVYTDSQGHVLEQKKTKGKTLNTVSTDIAHFSRYAVAW